MAAPVHSTPQTERTGVGTESEDASDREPTDASVASPATGRRGARFFGALSKYPAFRRLWVGALFASAGQWMQQVALGWLALTLTDSSSFVGIVAFTAGVPFLLIAPPGGALIDRVDRRRLMLTCQALAALLAIVVAGDVISGRIEPWHLLVAAFLNGSLQALLTPTQQSLVPGMVARPDLTNAIGLMSAGQNMTRVGGPSLAGVVIGWGGVGPAFLLQAAALVGAFVLVRGVAVPLRVAPTVAPRVFDGVALITRREDLRALFVLATIPTFFVFPYVSFLNVFARDILGIGAEGLGLLMAASGLGAVAGALLVAGRRRTEGTGSGLTRLTVAYGAVIVAIAVSRTLVVTLPLLFVAGLLGSSFMSGNNALMQHRISDDIRGRVMGVYLLTWGLMPLGALPMGLLADVVGAPVAVAAGAIVSSLLAAWLGARSAVLRAL